MRIERLRLVFLAPMSTVPHALTITALIVSVAYCKRESAELSVIKGLSQLEPSVNSVLKNVLVH